MNSSQFAFSKPDFWHNLFSPAGFMPRRICGIWTPGEIRLHNFSDFFIWAAYVAIPVVLLFFVLRRKAELPFRSLFVLFGLFIISCGTTHFMEIVMFYYPVYRLAGLIKFITAVVSWATVVALVPAIPTALAMRSPDALEREVEARTAELQVLNAQKDEFLAREQLSRREAEWARHEAERLREQAETANRAKDEFLMTLSHELRTPLNAIVGWASMLRMGELPPDMYEEALETIENSCWAQTRIVDDILEVSRTMTGKMRIESRPVALEPVVSAAYASTELAARAKNVTLSLDIQDNTVMVLGDGARLQQIVWNLLSNAVKFTPRGGEVKVTVSRHESLAQIEVKDSGEGIAAEFLPQVFDHFRQADSSATRVHGGLGLGLSIVRHLVEMHGGEVRVASEGVERGATFTVLLPILDVASDEIEITSERKKAPVELEVLKELKVLVVDDEPAVRRLVSMILDSQGAHTRVAASTGEAWAQLEEWQPDFLVSDIGMPEETGYQLMERLRQTPSKFQSIPALALTAYASGDDHERAIEAGFDSHLSKPVLPATLLAEIARLASQKK